MQKVTSFGLPMTVQSLEGLNPNDLNTLVSDALCTLPRISKPLSNIVYQKTKGNPFFAIAFLKSLTEEKLLEYSIRKRRWVWDLEQVDSMDVTGNVLHLLTSKMCRLSTSIQSTLKLAACFGAKIKECVLAAIATDSDHSDIRDKFEQVVNEGFMVKSGIADFRFVHDKVREAAYSLISESEKNQASTTLRQKRLEFHRLIIGVLTLRLITTIHLSQYHYNIGMLLYSTTKGEAADNVIIHIVDQIKRGIVQLEGETPELRSNIAKFTVAAVRNAVASSDHVAAFSYSTFALSLLPINGWESHYDLRLWFTIQSAKSCFSVGNVEKAQCIVQEVIEQCHSLQDKLPAYFLLALSKFHI